MKSMRPYPILFCLAVLMVVLRAEEQASAPFEVTVETATVTRTDLHRTVTVFGVVEGAPASSDAPGARSRLSSAMPGVLAAVECREGQAVKKGDILFRLDSRLVDVERDLARKNLDRQVKLLPVGGASEKSIQEAEARLASAEASKALLQIEAPFDGTIASINIQPGEAVHSSTVVGEILDPSRLVVTARVPAGDLASVKSGMPAEFVSNGRRISAQGRVIFISPGIDPATNTALSRITVPSGSGLQPGALVETRIISEVKSGVLAVPVASVFTDPDGVTTISVVENMHSRRVEITPGIRDGALVEISGNGLTEGQSVVTVGSYALPDGAGLRIVNPENQSR